MCARVLSELLSCFIVWNRIDLKQNESKLQFFLFVSFLRLYEHCCCCVMGNGSHVHRQPTLVGVLARCHVGHLGLFSLHHWYRRVPVTWRDTDMEMGQHGETRNRNTGERSSAVVNRSVREKNRAIISQCLNVM